MKKRKLKGFVLPTVYIAVMGALFLTISLLGSSLQNGLEYSNLSVSAITKDETTPVISNQDTESSKISKPFTSEKVMVSKSFYDMKDEASVQEKSLVYYKNTYLQNSGILYSSDEEFEVKSVAAGTVTNITKDEILGNVVEITHNTNLKTIYYSLGEISVDKDAAIDAGATIGKSGDNNLESEKENCLLFEVYYNGATIDPEEFYNMDLKDLQ